MEDFVIIEDPVKQGLKLSAAGTYVHGVLVIIEDPVKQGLKLIQSKPVCPSWDGYYRRSSKTRIETFLVMTN